MRELNSGQLLEIGKDGRPVRERYFSGVAPMECEYYAGHYRGENYPCLKDCRVQIASDPLVGHPPNRVATDMHVFAADFVNIVSDSDFLWAANNQVITPAEKLFRLV